MTEERNVKKIIIVGGVAGGASCAARLRRLDEEAQIILLEKTEYISYANCGLPYHVGDVITSRDALLVQKPEDFSSKFKVDVRTLHEAIEIDRTNKRLKIHDLKNDKTYDEGYDTLVLATGSSPLRPNIDGIQSNRIKTLWTVPDTDEIRKEIPNIKNVAVVGGGFIGLEMAENLNRRGLNVSLIEASNQVMAPLDIEMANLLHKNIQENNVDLYLNKGVQRFEEQNDTILIHLQDGTIVEADYVILSIGVRPNSQLAKEAGLEVNNRGGIVTDEYLQTSDPSIYAIGDVIEVEHFVSKEKTMIPLAGPANKQGRIVANNICGMNQTYKGTQGSSIAQVFDLVAASTGLNEKMLIQQGTEYKKLYVTQNSHAGYYPGAVPMTIKVLFSPKNKQILGAQIVGSDGVDKRIDTLGMAIRTKLEIDQLADMELAYAPPFSSAKDPINMVGFVAQNILNNQIQFSDYHLDNHTNAILLDVREVAETMAFSLPNATEIPLSDFRNHIDELDPSKEYIVFCAIGVRSYNVARILMNRGFKHVYVYPAGIRFYQANHNTEIKRVEKKQEPVDITVNQSDILELDCMGLQCPGPLMKVYEKMNSMEDGQLLEARASDPGFQSDIVAWATQTKNTLIETRKEKNQYVALLQKGTKQKDIEVKDTPEGKTIIVFSGDFDKVMASFIIANGAAAMGRPVTIFFTFWGLTVLRKKPEKKLSKSFIEKMFGWMLPTGVKDLGLSRMNMAGMGTAMMKKIMNDKNVDSLEDLMKKAMQNGVKLMACSMSMDVMGIKAEELIDGVEIGGVGTYLGDAENSNVNLFI